MSAATVSPNHRFTFECLSHLMIMLTITQMPIIRKRKVGLMPLHVLCLVTSSCSLGLAFYRGPETGGL